MKRMGRWNCLGIAVVVWLCLSALVSAVEIEFWHHLGPPSEPGGQETRGDWVIQMIRDFEALHPGIKVTSRDTGFAGYLDQYLQALAGGIAPDVILIRQEAMAGFVNRGILLPLNEWVARDGIDMNSIFPPGEVAGLRFDGTLYGMPFFPGGGNSLMIYHKRIFGEKGIDPDAALSNWDTYRNAIPKLLELTPSGAIDVLASEPIPGEVGPHFLRWLYVNDGNLFTPDGTGLLLNSPEAVETLEYLKELYDLQGGYRAAQSVNDRREFPFGKVATTADELWQTDVLRNQMDVNEIGVTLLPVNAANPNATFRSPVSNTPSLAIMASTKNPEAAWELIKWMSFEEGNRDFFWKQMRPSAAIQHVIDFPYQDQIPWWNVLLQVMQAGVGIHQTPVNGDIIVMLGGAVLSVLRGEEAAVGALEEADRVGEGLLNQWLHEREQDN